MNNSAASTISSSARFKARAILRRSSTLIPRGVFTIGKND
jgi:hypothetical protein